MSWKRNWKRAMLRKGKTDMYDWEPDFDDCNEPADPPGAYINGRWVAADELPMGWGNSPDWWDDDAFGETFAEYMEHTD